MSRFFPTEEEKKLAEELNNKYTLFGSKELAVAFKTNESDIKRKILCLKLKRDRKKIDKQYFINSREAVKLLMSFDTDEFNEEWISQFKSYVINIIHPIGNNVDF